MNDARTERNGSPRQTALLSLGALGIVFGDIGTSPLYAMRESFTGAGHELAVTDANVVGILSLIVWSLIIVISIKYLAFVMRAENDGEGGILALTSLVTPREARRGNGRWMLILIGLFGTALLYGDGMITPAISVLSAVEGSEVATEAFEPYVVPLAIAILVALFAVQRRGTGAVGRVFGPVMVLWFSTLGLLGAIEIAREPGVLRAFDPTRMVVFFADNPTTGFLALGSVFLVVTGGEALYADMGHFGRRPIALAWFSVAFPGLLLNYFGQGALLMGEPAAIDNPFYRLAPDGLVVPMVVLATAATVIASQALISGAFSLTMQASLLGYAPRMGVTHTSEEKSGQIYVPAINWALMIACVGLVIGFRSSTSLAAAYGVAVTMTMVITTLIFFVVIREFFGWSLARAAALAGAFLVVDLAFFGANIPKIPHGGWFPLVAGGLVFTLLTTWNTGRRIVAERIRKGDIPLEEFVESLEEEAAGRVRGTAVYLFSLPGLTPPALRANLDFQGVLHERVLVLSVITDEVPRVPVEDRVERKTIGHGVEQVVLHFGFLDQPDVPSGLHSVDVADLEEVTYFIGSEAIRVTDRPGMMKWRERLFTFMHRNATPVPSYFGLPANRTMAVGIQVEL